MRIHLFRFTLFILTALAIAFASHAQTVTPLVSEYTDHADGYFEVANPTLEPLVVVVEPRSFSVDENGDGKFRPLDTDVHVELSSSSLRLEPKQVARIFYKVKSERTPTWVCFYSSFTALKRRSGINVRLMLPHTVYVYQHKALERASIVISNVTYDPVTRQVHAQLENMSEKAGRAQAVELSRGHDSVEQGGFPVLPFAHRRITIAWKEDSLPEKLRLEFNNFSVQVPVQLVPQATQGQ